MNNKVKLKDIAKISSGSNAPKKEDFSESGLPFIRAGHLESLIDGLDIGNLPKVNEITSKNLKLKKAPIGSVLFAKSGMSSKKNRVYKTNGESFIVNHLACITSDSEIINNDYLKYFIEWYKPSTLIRDESYPSIRLSDISNIELELPSLSIQNKITKTLNLAVKIIKTRQQQIEALSKLQYSVFNKWFVVSDDKDAKVPLKDLCIINPRKSEVDEKLYEKEITFLSMASVSESGEVNLSETRILSDVYSNYTYFAEGDVLFAKITPCMENGKGAIVKDLKNKIGFGSTEFHVLRPNKGITPEWIYFLTKSSKFREKAEGNMTGSAGQKRVPRRFLENYQVTIPTKSQQKEFELFYHETEKVKQKLNQSLLEFEKLYQNLIHKSFNGELFKEDIKV